MCGWCDLRQQEWRPFERETPDTPLADLPRKKRVNIEWTDEMVDELALARARSFASRH